MTESREWVVSVSDKFQQFFCAPPHPKQFEGAFSNQVTHEWSMKIQKGLSPKDLVSLSVIFQISQLECMEPTSPPVTRRGCESSQSYHLLFNQLRHWSVVRIRSHSQLLLVGLLVLVHPSLQFYDTFIGSNLSCLVQHQNWPIRYTGTPMKILTWDFSSNSKKFWNNYY